MAPMDAAAAQGRVALQHCAACAALQYPPRALCRICLSEDLAWTVAETIPGEILAITTLHHSFEPAHRDALPLRIGLVRLEVQQTAIAFVPDAEPGARITLRAALDAQGRAILTAETAT